MTSKAFDFSSEAMGVLTEVAQQDRVLPEEVIRRALMLYHFVRVEMLKQGLVSGREIEVKVGERTFSVRVA